MTIPNGGNAPIHLAVMFDHIKVLQLLVNAGADVNLRCPLGPLCSGKDFQTPMHFVKSQHAAIILIKGGALVNVFNRWKQSPVFGVTDPGIIKIFKDNGLNLEVRDYEGETPLQYLLESARGYSTLKKYIKMAELLADNPESEIVEMVDNTLKRISLKDFQETNLYKILSESKFRESVIDSTFRNRIHEMRYFL